MTRHQSVASPILKRVLPGVTGSLELYDDIIVINRRDLHTHPTPTTDQIQLNLTDIIDLKLLACHLPDVMRLIIHTRNGKEVSMVYLKRHHHIACEVQLFIANQR